MKITVTPTRRAELEKLADRLAESWHAESWRYKIYTCSIRATLPRDRSTGTNERPRVIDSDRLDLPDFVAWRDAMINLQKANRLDGVEDKEVDAIVAQAAPFPRNSTENSLLHGFISARLAPDAATRRRQRAGREKGGKTHHRPPMQRDGKTIAAYEERYRFWLTRRKSQRGAALELARETGFSVHAIRTHARRHGWG